MKVVVVYNPRSGSALPKKQLQSMFKKADITVESFIDITDNFEKNIAKFVNQTTVVVVGFGGDGTLSSVASQLMNTKTVFAPLPGGTLNHFTKDLGIEQDLQAAIDRLKKAKIHYVDTASVNDQLFLNNSSIGLYPSSLVERSRTESQLGKWPAAVLASIKAFVRFRKYVVTIGDKTYTTPFIFVGNNHYDADALMARTAVNKGQLSIHMIHSDKRIALLKIALLTLLRRAQEAAEFTSFETDQLEIGINRRRVRVSFDGEHTRLTTPITYKINKKALKILK